MSHQNIFQLENISKNYGKIVALSSLSFSIKKGERVALIGPSGAGKTTLLNILSNIEQPSEGSLEIDGISYKAYTTRKQLSEKVGVIRQQFDLINQLSVINNVLAGRLGQWGLVKSLISLIYPQEKNIAIQALKRVGLSDKIYERTSHLSGGEQQRVALARLLVQNPKIVLADEPISSLDPARAEDILLILLKLVQEADQTLIASLHSVEYAKKYFTRIIALKEGKIYFDLPTEEVKDIHLSHLYTLKEME